MGKDLKFRKIQSKDADSIYQLNMRVQPFPWSKASISSECELNHSGSLVALHDNQIAGYIFMRNSGEEWELMAIGVDPEFQGAGLAKELFLKAAGGKTVFLEVAHTNSRALAFYRKLGFLEISKRNSYFSSGVDAICMKLNLADLK